MRIHNHSRGSGSRVQRVRADHAEKLGSVRGMAGQSSAQRLSEPNERDPVPKPIRAADLGWREGLHDQEAAPRWTSKSQSGRNGFAARLDWKTLQVEAARVRAADGEIYVPSARE
jgi:hypothetical protein